MNSEIKKPTLIEQGLQEIATETIYNDIVTVASKLDLAQSTIYEYLKGNVAKESRGKAILNELRKVIIKRNAA